MSHGEGGYELVVRADGHRAEDAVVGAVVHGVDVTLRGGNKRRLAEFSSPQKIFDLVMWGKRYQRPLAVYT